MMQDTMKRIVFALACAALVVSCGQPKKSPLQKKVDKYAVVSLAAPSLEGISDNGKEVLNLYRFAAAEADRIYWQQYFGDKALMEALPDPAERAYAMINYGPWDRIDGRPFVSGYGEKPAGAGLYPADLTAEEFEAFADPAKASPYTLIRRTADGSLEAVWYHDAFAEHVEKICSYLTAAADLTIVPSVRAYLLRKVEALRTDDYYAADLAWLDMDDSKMDLVIGPDVTGDDDRYGIKKSYQAIVMLKDLKRTEQLSKFSAMLPELQRSLPCEDAYKAFVPGTGSNIFACNALYYAGYADAGYKVIAVNLPYDERVQAEKGTRTILFPNILEEKFNRTVYPVGTLLMDADQQGHLDAEAFYWNTAFREVAQGLGVKETVTGRGSVAEALGAEALVYEKVKANIVGLYLACCLADRHELPAIISREDCITTFLMSLVRSARFGAEGATGRANIICYNYLAAQGAFSRNAAGKYRIDYARAFQAIQDLSALVLRTQATGDADFARTFDAGHAAVSESLAADIVNIGIENIPLDIRFE